MSDEHLRWRYPAAFGWRSVVLAAIALVLLVWTGARVEMNRAAALSAEGLGAALGLREDSQVARAFSTIGSQLFPPVIAERTDIAQIENFDPATLPPFAHIETEIREIPDLNPDTLKMETRQERQVVLVEPFGYVLKVGLKLLETLEIALWGTLLAVLLGFPLAILGASNLAPHPVVRWMSRTVVALLRAVPELISALFLVLAFGFGPIAGVLALALHAGGFFGKFYADDIESAERAPQEALAAIGASKLEILRHAILPQVMPQYMASTLYILDRNVRMATVVGLVGAGGVGQELKGRYDLYQYGHVGTILIAIFALVLMLELLANAVRRRYLR